jgi:lipopolysaccharide export system permease protein
LSIRDILRELKAIDRRLVELEDRRDIEAAMALTLGDFNQFQGREFTRNRLDIESNRSRYIKLRTELHSRFALSFSCFFFVLLGSPFAILQARRQFLTSFLMCFLPILLMYYPIVMLMMNLCKTETVSPVWAMWVGNVLLLAAGLSVLRKVMQH